jgi:hypothetical protein
MVISHLIHEQRDARYEVLIFHILSIISLEKFDNCNCIVLLGIHLEDIDGEMLFSGDCLLGKGPFRKKVRLMVSNRRMVLEEERGRVQKTGSLPGDFLMDIPLSNIQEISPARYGFSRGRSILVKHDNAETILSFKSDVAPIIQTIELCIEREKKERYQKRR